MAHSVSIGSILDTLRDHGYTCVWFQARYERIATRLEARYKAWMRAGRGRYVPTGQAVEAYRTAHLSRITKPLLLIQGANDEYGSASEARKFGLPRTVEVFPFAASHEYDDLSLQRKWMRSVTGFSGFCNE